MDKFLKQQNADDKRLVRQLNELHDQKMKDFMSSQKKEFKKKKEELKQTAKASMDSHHRSSWLTQKTDEWRNIFKEQEQKMREQNKVTFALERRKAQRGSILQKHNLERERLKDDTAWKHIQDQHDFALKQYDETRDKRHKHFEELGKLKQQQMIDQHQT